MRRELADIRAVEIAVDRAVTAIQDELVEKRIPVESVKRTGPIQMVLSFQNAELKPQIQKVLEDFPSFFEVEQSSTAQRAVYELREAEIKRIKYLIWCLEARENPGLYLEGLALYNRKSLDPDALLAELIAEDLQKKKMGVSCLSCKKKNCICKHL